jgi:hypothetical protein
MGRYVEMRMQYEEERASVQQLTELLEEQAAANSRYCPPPRWMHGFCMRHQVTWCVALGVMADILYVAPSHLACVISGYPQEQRAPQSVGRAVVALVMSSGLADVLDHPVSLTVGTDCVFCPAAARARRAARRRAWPRPSSTCARLSVRGTALSCYLLPPLPDHLDVAL